MSRCSCYRSRMTSLGQLLAKYLTPVIKMIQGWVNAFNKMPAPMQNVVVVIGMIIAAVGPLLLITGKMLTAVGTIMTFAPKLAGLGSTIGKTISTVWNAIKTLFTTIWNGIKTVFTTTVNAISTALSAAWILINTTITTVWNGIKTFFSTLWTGIKTVFTTALSGIQAGITTAFNTVSTFISTTWNTISSTISGIVNGIRTTVVNVFGQLVSGIQSKLSAVTGIVKNGFQGAINFITGLPSKALQWGKDFIGGIINGITGMIDKVKGAAKGVADAVSSVLHFSRPDEGPLRDYETWMPDFMEGLAQGIHESKGRVKAAIRQVVMEIRDEIGPLLKGSVLPGIEIFGSMGSVANRLQLVMDNLAAQMQRMGQQLLQGMQSLMQTLAAKVNQFLPVLQSGGGSGLFGISEDTIAKCRNMIQSLIAEAKAMGQQFMQDMLAGIRSMANMAKQAVVDAMNQIRRSMESMGGMDQSFRRMMGQMPVIASGKGMQVSGVVSGGDISAAGIRKLTDALTKVLQTSGGRSVAGGDIIIPVYLGSTILDEVVVSAQQRANLRSGGR